MSAPAGGHRDDAGPVDARDLVGRVGVVALVLGALAFVAVVVEGLADGLTFGLMLRWAAVFAVSLLCATAVMAALGAFGRAPTGKPRGLRRAALRRSRRPAGR